MADYFYPNQEIILPSLADNLKIDSDKFTVLQRFDGGMGTCYRIQDAYGKSYALKIIHSDLLMNNYAIIRYYEELKLWLTFSSCHGIAEAICIIQINDIPCVVSTWMDNGDMRSQLKSMDAEIFYASMDRIITSLKWVNDKYHVIHRDLKPGNILIDKSNNAYVADWGLAKLMQNERGLMQSGIKELGGINSSLTQHGSFVGTVLYASPEQLLGSPNIDHRSDIYSLGCIMYQWETGQPPFVARTLQEIASGHLYSKPKKIGGIFKSTNFKAEKIIMKCLEKRPEDRYQSYEELLSDLHKLAKKELSQFTPYKVRERYTSINIGHNEFVNKLKNGEIGLKGTKGFRLISQDDIMPYIREAVNLSNIGEHKKAIAIYRKLFIRELVETFPNFDYHKIVAINLAYDLNCIGESKEALDIITSISKAREKSAEYYVNLSNIHISLGDFSNCVIVCEEGLSKYPSDVDLIGNYTVGLTQLDRLPEAIASAEKRIKLGRDVHALCEAADVMYKYAEKQKNNDFPKALDLYKTSLRLYREALEINPRYKTALYNVALILFKMKRYVDSMAFCSNISKIENGTTEVNAFYSARNMLWTGAFKGVLDFCDNWLKRYPNSILLQRIRAEAMVDGFVIDHVDENGSHIVEKSSLDFFTNIVKDAKNRIPTDIIFLAKIHIWMDVKDHIEYGRKLLEWGKSLYPEYWKYDFYLADYYLKHKKKLLAFVEAIECKRKACWREIAYYMLARVYSARNDETLAAEMRNEYDRIKEEKSKLYESCKNL